MPSTLSVIAATHGYYLSSHSYSSSYLGQSNILQDEEDDPSIANLLNALGYLPGFSLANGVLRCVFAHNAEDLSVDSSTPLAKRHFKILKISQTLRGVIEFCGAGAIFLVPDCLITLARHAPWRNSSSTFHIYV
ncbi:MAG: hypothetical protein JSS62_03030 [Verrucomicrobia bacterium]|nr:hypothetical protein [Verrucomicrobiota bacterium]MBS0646030.1 hypothetical protein [Verrucomicrobiota bacterium]